MLLACVRRLLLLRGKRAAFNVGHPTGAGVPISGLQAEKQTPVRTNKFLDDTAQRIDSLWVIDWSEQMFASLLAVLSCLVNDLVLGL